MTAFGAKRTFDKAGQLKPRPCHLGARSCPGLATGLSCCVSGGRSLWLAAFLAFTGPLDLLTRYRAPLVTALNL